MGLFGSGFRPTIDPSMFAPAQAQPTDMTTAMPSLSSAPRGLFGGGSATGAAPNKWEMLASGISDSLDPLTTHPTGGGQLAALLKTRKQKDQEAALAAAITGKKFDLGAYLQAGGQPTEGMLTAMMPKDKTSQVVQRPDGSLWTGDPDDSTTWQQVGGPVAKASDPAEQQARLDEIKARTDYYKSGVGLRQNQGAYYGVKTAHPYAPQRGRPGGAPLKANPSSVKWD